MRVKLGGVPCVAQIDLATGSLVLLAPQRQIGVAGMFPIYHRTGKTIFFLDYDYMTIKRFTPGGALTTVLAAGVYLGDFTISPDGTRLAYPSEDTPGNYEIHVLNLGTKVSKPFGKTYGASSPSWAY